MSSAPAVPAPGTARQGQNRRQERWPDGRLLMPRLMYQAGCAAGLTRSTQGADGGVSPPMTSKTCTSSATTSSPTGPRSRPTGRPGAPMSEYRRRKRRRRNLRWRSTSTRSSCACMNAAKEGTQSAHGPKFGPIGLIETLEAAKELRSLEGAARPEPGPRGRIGLLVQHRRPDHGQRRAQRGRQRQPDRRYARTSAASGPRSR